MVKLFDSHGDETTRPLSMRLWRDDLNRLHLYESIVDEQLAIDNKMVYVRVADLIGLSNNLQGKQMKYKEDMLIYSLEIENSIFILIDQRAKDRGPEYINYLLAKEIIVIGQVGVLMDLEKHEEALNSDYIEDSAVNLLLPNSKVAGYMREASDSYVANMYCVPQYAVARKKRINQRELKRRS